MPTPFRPILAVRGFSLAAPLLATAAAALAADCNGDRPLGKALEATILAKARFADDPARYCQMERKQLRQAEAYYSWISNHRDCYLGDRFGHLLQTVAGLVATARKDVAEDCP